jgi:hypothetical protein
MKGEVRNSWEKERKSSNIFEKTLFKVKNIKGGRKRRVEEEE